MTMLVIIGFLFLVASFMGWRAIHVILVFATGGIWIIPWIAIELASRDKE